jgi:protocatechuate 3,4-dioxygenase beta subunit
LFSTTAIWRRITDGITRRRRRKAGDGLRICRFEQMEPRQLMTAAPPQIHFGSVFFDPAPGTSTTPNTIQITFQGGAPGTQLTQLIIDGSKNQTGLAVGDIVWTTPGNPNQSGQSPLTIVSHNGFDVVSQSAINGGSQIVLTLSGFDPGEKLVLTDNAEKIAAIDPVTHALTTTPLTKGNDFQNSHLFGTFTAPHYVNLSVNTGYVAGFDTLVQTNAATYGSSLDLPPQSYMPPSTSDQSNQTAGADVLVTQTPLPISIGGRVFSDPNLNNRQDSGEPGVSGVSLALYTLNGSQYIATGKTTTTDANGDYLFQWLLPGTYEVAETVPQGYFAVGASVGTVNDSADGTVASSTVINQVALLGGEDSVENDFSLAQASSLSGYVYHDANNNGIREIGENGIGGVTIVVNPVQTLDGSTAARTTLTAADGSWSVSGLAPGQYKVTETTQPPGYLDGKVTPGSLGGTVASVGDEIDNVTLLGGQSGTEYDFGKRLPASLSGNVTDCLAGQPLSGVTVQLLDSNGNVIQTTTTDAQGNYKFSNLMPGQTYGVNEILPPGFVHNDENVGNAGGVIAGDASIIRISVGDGANATGYDFCDVQPASIAGNVGDCLANQPLSGVTVQLLDSSGNIIETTTTDSQGNYKFSNLTPGQVYGVSEILPPGYMHNDEHIGTASGVIVNHTIVQVSLGDGVPATGYNFCDVLPASLSGRVISTVTQECDADPNPQPVSGVTIQLLDANGKVLETTTTDAQGDYQFTNLTPGVKYGLHEVQPVGLFENDADAGTAGGTVVGKDTVTSVLLGSGVAGLHYDFCNWLPASISGRVVTTVTQECGGDPTPLPVGEVTIQLLDANRQVIQTTTTDSQGNYQFTNLTPWLQYGVHEVQPVGLFENDADVGTAGGTAVGKDTVTSVLLGSGVAGLHYDFCDWLPASISGRVVTTLTQDCNADPNPQPVAGVTIQLLDADGDVVKSTTTDASGDYQFSGLTPWVQYTVHELQPTGLFENDADVGSVGGMAVGADTIEQILPGSGVIAVNYNFCLLKPASISGVVHIDTTGNCETATNEPTLAGVTIDLLDSEGNVLQTTVTNAAGAYSFTNLMPGEYGVRAEQPAGYFSEDADLGTIDGTAVGVTVGVDTTSQIVLHSGAAGVNYDFCVEPPSTISGYVFQDGPPITLPQGVTLTPAQVSLYRTGVFQPSDKRIAGVTLYLGNGDGQVILDNNLQPITAVTDANGYYQFTGLQAGNYTVLEQLPDSASSFIPGLITAGSSGGVPLNAGVTLSPSLIQQLAIPSTSTAIVEIPLGIGANSTNNNFSVVATQSPPNIPPPSPLPPPPPLPPIENPPIPQVAVVPLASPITFVPQIPLPVFEHFAVGGASDTEYTWHLSIIDGGQPRETDDSGAVQFAPAGFNVNSWNGIDLSRSQWIVNDGKGDPNLRYVFGTPGAIPISGDFVGDGKTRMGVFIDGEWFIDMNGDGIWDAGDLYCKLGGPGDKPVVGDWDGDGKDDIGVFGPAWSRDPRALSREPGLPKPHNPPTGAKKNHPPQPEESSGERTMKLTSRGKLRSDVVDHVFQFGHQGDIPVVGDWTGSGVKTIGVFHDGTWLLDTNGDGHFGPEDVMAHFGQKGDIPVVGDWDNSGRDSIGVFRNGKWILDKNHNFEEDPGDETRQLGAAGDTPVVGDWSGSGHAEIGVYHNGTLERPPAK